MSISKKALATIAWHLEQRRQLRLDPCLGWPHGVPHDQRPCQRAQQHLPAADLSRVHNDWVTVVSV